MSCPICHIGGGSYSVSRSTQQNKNIKKGPSNYSNYPPYPGPQDTLTLANERALDYPYIHAKIYNRTPTPGYLQLKVMADKERADEERHRPRPTHYGGKYCVRDALCHLEAAERILKH